ncbi:hypothetical protein AAE478_001177 [Parahypoxylon ruwenzoriense]
MYLTRLTHSALLLAGARVSSLKIANSLGVLEWTPSLVAKEDYFDGNVTIVNGGIASLFSDPTVDLGANSETQLLLQYGTHRNLRTIVTIVEVYYRIVASRKAGVAEPADLKGKRIGATTTTSSEYFVRRYLANAAGLEPGDFTVVFGMGCLREPCGANTFPEMLRAGEIDAIGMWEPTVELGIRALGADDAVVFGGYSDDSEEEQGAYREMYNLATTTEKLDDPAKRAEIVGFLRALDRAERDFREDPDAVVGRAAEAVGIDAEVLRAAWPVHKWTARVPPDMVDFLVEEDPFVAGNARREVLSREDIAPVIDASVLEEALGT